MPLSGKSATTPTERFTRPPDPSRARDLGDLIEQLRLLKVWAGDPSYEMIKDRVNAAWTEAGRPAGELIGKSTLAHCFQPGRRRLNTDLLVAVVEALHPDTGYVTQWRQALRVLGGETEAASQVRVQDRLPPDLAGFIGRTVELDRLRHAAKAGDAVVISAIEGMAGVGKTQLAVHAGHLIHQDEPFDRVLFVNLRGFHPDPVQPPADPAAVLDGFLRLLGVPGQQIPHDLDGRVTLYRDRLAGTRALVVLDNAATAEQVRLLLPATPGCLTVVTSRRRLTDLDCATHLTVDVLTADEAVALLLHAVPEVPTGGDPHAAVRIARRCGHLPLALGVVAGHVRSTPGWTLTDHADRLDEHHHDRRLDAGVEVALNMSYQHLPAERRRLLRLAALHPGDDLDAHAAAALADTELATAEELLHHLHRDHLLQRSTPGRYAFHDLVHVFATVRTIDEDRPAERRTALTRLFDYYLATAATAMNTLHPGEGHLRPAIHPTATPSPDLTQPDAAREWLDTERPTLIAVAAHTAAHGWPTHTTRLSRVLFRYLDGGHHCDALTLYGHSLQAARDSGDPTEQAHAVTDLGAAYFRLGRYGPAGEHYQQALDLFRQVGDPAGEARALGNLGVIAERSGHYRRATERFTQALPLFRRTGDRTGEARALNSLGNVQARLGHHTPAIDHHEQALTLHRQAGNQHGEAVTLNNLGDAEVRAGGRYGPAGDHLRQALALYRQLGHPAGEANALDSIGILHTRLGRPDHATDHHQRALAIFRETGDRYGEAWSLNGLGEAAHIAGRAADVLAHHTAALAIAADIGDRDQQARAHAGLGHAHRSLGDPARAREDYERALALYTDLDLPEADQIRAHLNISASLGAGAASRPETPPPRPGR